jgi:hypothetical protein
MSDSTPAPCPLRCLNLQVINAHTRFQIAVEQASTQLARDLDAAAGLAEQARARASVTPPHNLDVHE